MCAGEPGLDLELGLWCWVAVEPLLSLVGPVPWGTPEVAVSHKEEEEEEDDEEDW